MNLSIAIDSSYQPDAVSKYYRGGEFEVRWRSKQIASFPFSLPLHLLPFIHHLYLINVIWSIFGSTSNYYWLRSASSIHVNIYETIL